MTDLEALAGQDGQLRDFSGRFLPKLRWTPEGSCEWLIWSKYHRAWHRKSSSGGACGYTDDIARAGLFPRHVAAAYNDDRDRPYHVSEKMRDITRAIDAHNEAIGLLSALRARATLERAQAEGE